MTVIDFKLVILYFCILSVVLNSGSGAPLEKHEFQVRKLRVKDENGGKDWILELKGDIIIDQYREGVSSFQIILIASLIAIMLPGSHILLIRTNEAAMDEKSHPVRHRQFLLSATEKRDRRRTSKIDVPAGPLCQVCTKVERKNYVHVWKGEGCSSMVGMRGGKQFLSLEDDCVQHTTVLHEFTHALGFDHTQCRSDRDKYVDILWNNIIEDEKHNFDRERRTNNEVVPFDYYSIMIYAPYSFAIDTRKPTMAPRHPQKRLFGDIEKMKLSPNDIKMIKKFYKC